MMVFCQNSLGVGMPDPPIINASSAESARETGTEDADISASN